VNRCRLVSCVLVLLVLSVAPAVMAQTSIVVRGVAASLGGASPVRATGMAGVGVGVESGEYLEVFGEFAQASGITYPPEPPHQSGSFGVPTIITLAVVEWSRYDRLLIGGGRVSTSKAMPLWAFAEVGGGLTRRREVLNSGGSELSLLTAYRPVVLFGGGVAARVRRLEVEASYRLGVINQYDYDRVNQVRAAAGLRF
jgi:hypothetical protein